MNNQIYNGNWNEFKGKVRKIWGEVSDDEFETTKGNIEQVYGKIQSKYGEAVDLVQEKLKSLLGKINKAF
jgi:uncharacterized protein YjbJ (UPF0337 family)